MTLLIVDDHAAMRRLIGRVSDMVSEIEECGEGAEALAAYHRCLPDWVLMDIEMDQVDGITATREILLSYSRARVVIVSEYDDTEVTTVNVGASVIQPAGQLAVAPTGTSVYVPVSSFFNDHDSVISTATNQRVATFSTGAAAEIQASINNNQRCSEVSLRKLVREFKGECNQLGDP